MRKTELEKYEKLLLKKREELAEQIKQTKDVRDSTSKEASGDLSSYSYHMADQGTDTMEREKAFMFASKSGSSGSARYAVNRYKRPGWRRFRMPDCVSNAKRRKRRPKLADINKRHLLVPFLMLAAVVIADQLSKSYALNHLTEGRIHRLAGSFFQFKLVFNKGGALGTDFGSGAFYLISSLLILLIVIYLIVVNRDKLFISVPIAAIAGGAAGNIIDRIRIGKVVDFIDVDFFDINAFGLNIDRWWVFNIADAAITVGVIFLLVYLLFYGKKREVIESGAGLPTDKIAGKMN